MPGTKDEKLFGLPGPQNSAVLMDIISKLKQDLQQSRAENNKLVDQLNCLISLVKRSWTGEQGAIIHLANIVGMEAPAFNMTDMNRNTPIPDKTRAVKNWERLSIRLLQREYEAIQREIREKQQQFLQNRQQYMTEVMDDHSREMSRFALHKNSSVSEVDKRFMRCFSAKTRKEPNKLHPSAVNRPKSAYRSKPPTAADMVEGSDVTMAELVGQQSQHASNVSLQQNHHATDSTFQVGYRLASHENRHGDRQPLIRHRDNFDDPNRYKQTHLFDPDVIFGPQTMSAGGPGGKEPQAGAMRERPLSATTSMRHDRPRKGLASRPSTAVFITENRPDRPLKFETTRPVSGKPNRPISGSTVRGRRHSAPSRRPVPHSVNKKELHHRPNPTHAFGGPETEQGDNLSNINQNRLDGEFHQDFEDNYVDYANDPSNGENNYSSPPPSPKQKPPISVSVRKNDPVDKFVEELKLMEEMESEFKKSTLSLQKKLGLEREGFVL